MHKQIKPQFPIFACLHDMQYYPAAIFTREVSISHNYFTVSGKQGDLGDCLLLTPGNP